MCVKDPSSGKWIDCHRRTSSTRAPAPPPEVIVLATHSSGMDTDQVMSLYGRTYRRDDDKDGKVTAALKKDWSQWCEEKANEASSIDGAPGGDLAVSFRALKESAPESSKQVRAIMDLDESLERGQSALSRQMVSAAALRGVSPEEARERFTAFREQFLSMPRAERPKAPGTWIKGFTSRDRMSASAPSDPATLFATYRVQADPQAFPDHPRTYAVVDLETAGPTGKEGFMPEHGCIIEVGVVTYDEKGQELGGFESMVRPSDEAEKTYRTGAVNCHGIEWKDVEDAPSWSAVSAQTVDSLRGSTMVAQNDSFERAWLHDHLGREGHDFDHEAPGVDTMRLAKQHLSLPNHRLETICKEMGVEYSNGHRATHDARAAGQAFFAMRERITQNWKDDATRRDLPQPPTAKMPSNVTFIGRKQADGRMDAERPQKKGA